MTPKLNFCWGLGLDWVLIWSQAQKFLSNRTIIAMFEFWEIPKINCGFDKYGHTNISCTNLKYLPWHSS
jgi:hypothetical protein